MQVTLLEHRLHVLSVRAEVVPRMAFPLVRLLAQASAGDRCNRPLCCSGAQLTWRRFFSCSSTAEEMTLVLDEGLLGQLEADVAALRFDERPYRAWPQVWVAMQVDQGEAVADGTQALPSTAELPATPPCSAPPAHTHTSDAAQTRRGSSSR